MRMSTYIKPCAEEAILSKKQILACVCLNLLRG